MYRFKNHDKTSYRNGKIGFRFLEKLAEYAYGASKGKKITYILKFK